ncbi:MAG: DUF2508 family protein [Firmicutes bacterium]|jgi:hypothetical protein|nr:DUF2508 family protein [Bacillota bacterium]
MDLWLSLDRTLELARQRLSLTRQTGESAEETRLRNEIRAVCADMERADRVFNDATDPDIIDAAIYTMRACERRLGYLVKQAKRLRATECAEGWDQAPLLGQIGVDTRSGPC